MDGFSADKGKLLERIIARQFAIECWPTTVEIDEEGRLAGVQLGMRREYPANEHSGRDPHPQSEEKPK